MRDSVTRLALDLRRPARRSLSPAAKPPEESGQGQAQKKKRVRGRPAEKTSAKKAAVSRPRCPRRRSSPRCEPACEAATTVLGGCRLAVMVDARRRQRTRCRGPDFVPTQFGEGHLAPGHYPIVEARPTRAGSPALFVLEPSQRAAGVGVNHRFTSLDGLEPSGELGLPCRAHVDRARAPSELVDQLLPLALGELERLLVDPLSGVSHDGESTTNPNTARGRVRTCDLWLRRPTLYPAELRARSRCL